MAAEVVSLCPVPQGLNAHLFGETAEKSIFLIDQSLSQNILMTEFMRIYTVTDLFREQSLQTFKFNDLDFLKGPRKFRKFIIKI